MQSEKLRALDAVIDHESLLTRCLNKLDFAERMLMLYQGHCAGELTELDQAFERGDMESVRRIAHRVAGASANAAAFGMRAKATELRHAIDGGSVDVAKECLTQLREEWDKVNSAMSEFCTPAGQVT